MTRLIVGGLGVLSALFPYRTIELFETLAIDNPDECSTRPWLGTGIRAEGVVITVASLVGGRAFAGMMTLTGAFGALVLLFPDIYRRIASTLVYEHPRDVEWNEGFTPGVRVIGLGYVFLAVNELRKHRTDG
ncbi:hypothetical protein [Natronorarus salvus]|uniref:hypothetical protein n=1 Tax=Natronorarus salvus TaxID=3117733 RepID=UPI002F267C4E